jgi:hypothetical protein
MFSALPHKRKCEMLMDEIIIYDISGALVSLNCLDQSNLNV